ncbi:hypothetical protein DLK05_05630 [Ancylomarina longa]|uniref:Uncharacterized protein n=2 Tax=Ancylomarina longa TaxID=2487017 RepID=A0A434AWS8_9BACT|nr:hypothetical protein DLK05_05630 [Ancylomarina longa]
MFLLVLSGGMANAQAVAIKKWKGRYPRMKNSYPQAFISFKGWLPPVPHLFVKTPFTHYYLKVKSVPSTDSREITGKTKTGLLRIFSRLIEKSQFKGRYKETGMIKVISEFQKQIDQKLFDSRRDQLEDIYGLTATFLVLYKNMDNLDHIEYGRRVKKLLKTEVNELLQQFLMINLLEADHGAKFKAFTEMQRSLIQLSGEVDYTLNKMKFFNSYGKYNTNHYAFLSQ